MALQLLHHWDFHENIGSTVGDIASGNTGTISTPTNQFSWVTGRNSSPALFCNGQVENDWDYVSTANEVSSGGIGSFAIAVWFKQPSKYGGIICGLQTPQTWSETRTHGNCLFIKYVSGLKYYLSFGSGSSHISYDIDNGSISDNNWHNLIGAYCSATGQGRIFIDGYQKAVGNISEYTASGWWKMFGCGMPAGTSGNATLAATFDDVRIYLGCITDCEALALYNDQLPSICDSPANALMFSCNT